MHVYLIIFEGAKLQRGLFTEGPNNWGPFYRNTKIRAECANFWILWIRQVTLIWNGLYKFYFIRFPKYFLICSSVCTTWRKLLYTSYILQIVLYIEKHRAKLNFKELSSPLMSKMVRYRPAQKVVHTKLWLTK